MLFMCSFTISPNHSKITTNFKKVFLQRTQTIKDFLFQSWAFVAFRKFRNYDLRVSICSSGSKAVKGLRPDLRKSQGLRRYSAVNRAINSPSLDLSSELHVNDKRENMNFHFHV
ncbi:hypothetical protein CDAR_38061 [Caerostris darwini]|uniref:Uncharacterized protein n=1 Tax=Caerostris darwini TaxID=1538125 RepID=A0AAV4WFP9_9ARAC|nr:hypothetical protein CDAR_38061 [Caerostris darwini]